MIDPTKKDIGRAVVYVEFDGSRQDGVITSFNDYCVWVRYGLHHGSQATSREDLEWSSI